MREQAASIWALVRRGLNEIVRVPTGALPGVLAPSIFMIGLSGVYGAAAQLPGFPTSDFRSFVLALGFLQASSFAGAATGVNLARDIERGWFDRMVVCPAPRTTLLGGIVASAMLRSLLPTTVLVSIGFLLGVHWPGIGGLLIAYALGLGMCAAFACWGVSVALRFRTQQAAPLIHLLGLVTLMFAPAYAPRELLSPWLQHLAAINPVAYAMDGIRQGFISELAWDTSLYATAAVAGLILVLGGLAIRGMQRIGVRT